MADTEAATLLDDLTALRRKARHDSHAYWLPLLLFGVLVLAGALLYRGHYGDFTRISPYSPLRLFTGDLFSGTDPTAVGVYWLAVAVVGALATLAWYWWRGRRTGLHVRIGAYLVSLGAALLVMLGVVPLATTWVLQLLFVVPVALWVSAGVFVVGLVIAAVFRRFTWVVVVGGVIAILAAGNIAVLAPLHGFGGLLVIGVGLFGLAWAQRSVGATVVAVLFTAAALLANLYDMENIFFRLFGGFTDNETTIAFQSLLVPALVLLIGGVVALVTGRKGTAR